MQTERSTPPRQHKQWLDTAPQIPGNEANRPIPTAMKTKKILEEIIELAVNGHIMLVITERRYVIVS